MTLDEIIDFHLELAELSGHNEEWSKRHRDAAHELSKIPPLQQGMAKRDREELIMFHQNVAHSGIDLLQDQLNYIFSDRNPATGEYREQSMVEAALDQLRRAITYAGGLG